MSDVSGGGEIRTHGSLARSPVARRQKKPTWPPTAALVCQFLDSWNDPDRDVAQLTDGKIWYHELLSASGCESATYERAGSRSAILIGRARELRSKSYRNACYERKSVEGLSGRTY